MDEVVHALPGGYLLVIPDAGVPGRDAAVRANAGCFGDHHAGTAGGAAAEVHDVPVGRHAVAVFASVLAHWRNKDSVANLEAANRDWFKEFDVCAHNAKPKVLAHGFSNRHR
jgi:hypothetical protein